MRRWMVVAGTAAVGARIVYARHRRVLHPRGRSFEGRVRVWVLPDGPVGAGLIDTPADYPATVRVSKGTPTPEGWPDLMGLAVRLHDTDRGQPFDLLLSTSGRSRVLRWMPLPRRAFASAYGSILPYRTGGDRSTRLHVAALPDPGSAPLGVTLDTVTRAALDGSARFVLAVSEPGGIWRPFGRLTFGRPLPAPVDARLGFDPTRHQTPGLYPSGPVQALRGVTYRLAQRWRGAQVEDDGPSAAQTATAH